jgi:hypothetical protein
MKNFISRLAVFVACAVISYAAATMPSAKTNAEAPVACDKKAFPMCSNGTCPEGKACYGSGVVLPNGDFDGSCGCEPKRKPEEE